MEHDSATAPLADIASMLGEFEELRAELWTIHFRTVLPMMLAMQIYDEFYADLFGGTEADAHALLGGRLTRSVAAGIGLSDLAAIRPHGRAGSADHRHSNGLADPAAPHVGGGPRLSR